LVDIFTKEQRSSIMSKIRAVDTKPELIVDSWLADMGYFNHYVRNWKKRIGSPDFYFFGFDGYLFVDGAFWHGHPDHFTFGKSGKYWDDKMRRNMERDSEVNEEILGSGGRLLRVWDFEVLKYESITKERISDFINEGI